MRRGALLRRGANVIAGIRFKEAFRLSHKVLLRSGNNGGCANTKLKVPSLQLHEHETTILQIPATPPFAGVAGLFFRLYFHRYDTDAAGVWTLPRADQAGE